MPIPLHVLNLMKMGLLLKMKMGLLLKEVCLLRQRSMMQIHMSSM